jgi:hypothetical protein
MCFLVMWENVLGFSTGISISTIPTGYSPGYFGSLPYSGILSLRLFGGLVLGCCAFGTSCVLDFSPLGRVSTDWGKIEEEGMAGRKYPGTDNAARSVCW